MKLRNLAAFLAASCFGSLLILGCCSTSPKKTTDGGITRQIGAQTVTLRVLGFESAQTDAPTGEPERVAETYDVIIVGGGMSGLTAGWYLRDRKTIILERKDTAGGLAFRGRTQDGTIYARGSAYYSKPRKQVAKIYSELGMPPLEETAIPEPIDSFYFNGKLHENVWEEHALKELPEGFAKFKAALLKVDDDGLVPEQPIDEAKDLTLDTMTAAEWIKPFGPELKGFLDSYSQSALGAKTDYVNALAFCNFYLAEIETRYTWPGGTGGGSTQLIEKLTRHNPSMIRTNATVTKVKNVDGGVEVTWSADGRGHVARAKFAIVTVPLRVAAWIVDGYPADRKAMVDKLPYADYLVHTVLTSKDLFTKSYDTWFAGRSFTDVITARWMETSGFTKPGKPGPGVLSIYQPLEPARGVRALDPESVATLACTAIAELGSMIPELATEPTLHVECYRWPSSIHIVPPKYFTEWAPKLKAPVGRVYFAGNNLGTPSFEEALYRGWRAAEDVKPLLSWVPSRPAREGVLAGR